MCDTIEQAARVIRDAIGHFRASESMAEAAAQALSDAGLLAGGWRPISEAPREVDLLCWGNGYARIMRRDAQGQWRNGFGHPKGAPKVWTALPSPPEEGA